MIPFRSVAYVLGIILLMLIIISLFDIVMAIFSRRFYTTAAFVVLFGVGGIFASVFSYAEGIKQAEVKNETARWTVILTLIITGCLFFFILSNLEGGEYAPAFKAYGAALALTSLLFFKGKVEL